MELNERTRTLSGLEQGLNRNVTMTSMIMKTRTNIKTKREMEQGNGRIDDNGRIRMKPMRKKPETRSLGDSDEDRF